MPKLGLLIFRPDPKRFEHFLLQVRLVDPHAAAAYLNAVQNHVVRLGANFREFLRFKQRYVVRFWSGERMMHRFHLFSSGLHSNSGKSVTQRKSQISTAGMSFCISAMRSRNRPRTSQAISHLSAPKKTQSPSSMLSFDFSKAFSGSLKNFTMGDFHSPFSILMEARPFAPYNFAISVSSSAWPIVIPAKPLAFIAFTTPPASSALRKTLKLLSRKISPRSTSSI